MRYKPKIIKNMKVKYDGKEYDNITQVSRGYEYSSFCYLDAQGSECSVYLSKGQQLTIVDTES